METISGVSSAASARNLYRMMRSESEVALFKTAVTSVNSNRVVALSLQVRVGNQGTYGRDTIENVTATRSSPEGLGRPAKASKARTSEVELDMTGRRVKK